MKTIEIPMIPNHINLDKEIKPSCYVWRHNKKKRTIKIEYTIIDLNPYSIERKKRKRTTKIICNEDMRECKIEHAKIT